MSKTTCFEPFFPGQFFNVQMWEKCTPLLREAHFQVKMLKTQHARTTTLDYAPLHYTTLHYATLHYSTLHYATLQYSALHNTPLHYTSLHYTDLRVGLMGGPPPRNNRDYPRNRGFKFQTGFKQVRYFRINTNEFPKCRECATPAHPRHIPGTPAHPRHIPGTPAHPRECAGDVPGMFQVLGRINPKKQEILKK